MRELLTAGLVFLAGPALAAPILNAPKDVAAIHAIEHRNAVELDDTALARAYAPNAVVLDYMTGGVYRGRAAIKKGFAAQLTPIKSVSARILEQNVITDGRFACDLMTTNFHFVTKSGKAGAVSLRQMDALEKLHGRWEVVQEQVSAPEDPKTGMAVMSNLPIRGDIAWPADMAASQTIPPAQAYKEIRRWTHDSLRVIGINAILPYYGPGAEELAMYGPILPGNLRGKAQMRAYYAPSMNSFASLVTTTPVLKINTDGTLGAQIDIQNITLHLKNGKTQALYWRQSDCVHRIAGKWYGILDMSSFPVDLTTGKTATTWAAFPMGPNAENSAPQH